MRVWGEWKSGGLWPWPGGVGKHYWRLASGAGNKYAGVCCGEVSGTGSCCAWVKTLQLSVAKTWLSGSSLCLGIALGLLMNSVSAQAKGVGSVHSLFLLFPIQLKTMSVSHNVTWR